MRETFQIKAFALPVAQAAVRAQWQREGFSFGVFRDPPGQEWNDFVHGTDEYVLVAEGRLDVSVGLSRAIVEPGDLVRIPKGVRHSLKTVSKGGSVWLYGYGHWGAADD
ncbi:MAG: cupin domain-containing protein [Kiloniellales bacterium]